ncbi:uncharacterized protein N7469_009054 [Penicillium citrinum]|uniref:D-xylose reductase [NAD(P)H] n=1 Tax=Penicillium citrinum TaxID=5077 RepID=A0A9W9THN0_PENCI|nr:uncharacterized protein N7469_009054 [Penicillium citrinum]KAJ5222814.1 hypothetical protein N7469_009054 [Penicillium citrinum]
MASLTARATRMPMFRASISSRQPLSRSLTTRATSYKLNTGAKIPQLGSEYFKIPSLRERLSARVYDVEKEKLWCDDYHPDDVERALDDSLRDLDTPYVDLLLVHYPCTSKRGSDRFPRDADGRMILGETTYVETWRAMEKLTSTGKAKAIGVSNFSKDEIETLLRETSTVPAVHQMEAHPYLQQKDFNECLRAKGIHVVQFSPLGNKNDFYRQTGWSKQIAHMMRIIDQPILKDIGQKYGKSPVQVVLAWCINSGRSVIPKSVVDWQIEENLEADFELQLEDMAQIATLDAQARFNDPSLDYEWRLYSDLEGIHGTMRGKTH